MKNSLIKRRGTFVLVLLLAVSLTFAAVVLAAPTAVEDQGVTDSLDLDDGVAEDAEYSHRVVVELESPSVISRFAGDSTLRGPSGQLDLRAPAVATYRAQLAAQQADFISRVGSVLPEASVAGYINETGERVEATYQLVLNAVALDPGEDVQLAQKKLAKMDGVKAVYLDYAHDPDLYASLPLINAEAVWDQAGGRADAGSGVLFASMDGGVHSQAPMFDGTGFPAPPAGFPKGDPLNTNNKVVVSRAYFRDWDPPAPGDENTWPGENGTPHGTHTASTAAGNVINGFEYAGTNITDTISGVAPGAWVMSYRVFYYSVTGDGSFYTVEGIAALEDIVADGAEVLNNSWGGGPGSIGGEFDPLDAALIATSQAGVFVSMSNGNAGPGTGTGDHPSPDYINVAASTTSGTYGAGRIHISGPTPVITELQNMPMGVGLFGEQLPAGDTYPYNYVTALSVDPANVEGCDEWEGTPFDGVAALISRGTCNFSQKVYYAEQAGAEMVVIYNNAGDDVINMSCGVFCGPGEITIPSFFIGQTDGEGAIAWYDDHGAASELTVDYLAYFVGNEPDYIADFSSRGPGVGNVLKPDIAAPGVNIMAQGYAVGATGEDRHLGFGQVSGTSMASPHVAGAATVLREIHPTWTNAEIKSALMSTSKYMDIYNSDGSPAQPLDMGAGRLDLTNAADPGVILDPPSVSFGQMVTGTMDTIAIEVTSVAAATESYTLTTLYTGASFTQTTSLPGFAVTPASITLDPGESTTISVTFNTSEGMGLGDNQGYIIMEGDNGHHAHMPAWARVAAPSSGEVLLIDNDGSYLLGYPDYAGYYADALTELGIPFDYWNAELYFNNPTSIPEAAVLEAYDAVIYFTGDYFYADGSFTVATPLTALDMDRLTEYANAGGIVIAMGQDATSVMNESYFAEAVLGAQQLQDSVTGFELPELPVVPSEQAPEAFQELILDLSGPDTFIGMASLPQDPAPVPPAVTFLPVIRGTSGTGPLPPAPTGTAWFDYNTESNRFDYQVTLTATVPFTLTASHIHEGGPFESGPVLYPLFSGPAYVTDTITFEGSLVIDEADEGTLMNGGLYLNTHTTVRPVSAVRTQIMLSPANNGANNQYYMDELEPVPGFEPNPVPGTLYPYQPLLAYPGDTQIEDGIVAMAHRDQPNLEYPGIDYLGRSIFTSFGLEGINNTDQTTTREDLLWHLLMWAWDEPEVAIDDITGTYSDTTSLTVLEANVTSNITGTTGVSYRWDFGDGTELTVPYESNVVSHTYAASYCNTDVDVRVEAVDSWGNHVIGSETITVTNCAFDGGS